MSCVFRVILSNDHNSVDACLIWHHLIMMLRDVSLTCWCHLSNIMPDSTFHESMGQGIYNLFCFSFLFVSLYFVVTVVFVFCCLFFVGWYFSFPLDGVDVISFTTIKSVGLISLRWDSKSETCQGIQTKKFILRFIFSGTIKK